MTSILENLGGLAFWGLVLAVPVGTLAWHTWQLSIKPRLIPRDKIKHMADELEARYGDDAENVAFTEEDSAWRRSETFQQGLWYQVRLELYRRRKA
jgi:hypothetical protein